MPDQFTDSEPVTILDPVPMDEAILAKAEQTIERGLVAMHRQWLPVAKALRLIRNNQGYRQRGYRTFESYCQDKFHVDARRAYDFMAALGVVEIARTSAQNEPTLSNAIAVSALPSDEQKRVIAEVDLAKTPTRQVQQIVRQAVPKPTSHTARQPRVVTQAENAYETDGEGRSVPRADPVVARPSVLPVEPPSPGWQRFLDFATYCDGKLPEALGQLAVREYGQDRLYRLRDFIVAAADEARRLA